MWLTAPNRIGIAAWQADDSVWRIESRISDDSVRICVGNESLALISSDSTELPKLDEQFVRGDELHLSFPQTRDQCEFGFRLVIRPVKSESLGTDADRAVFELIVSIETTLLDSHPTVDLFIPSINGVACREVNGVGNAIHCANGATANWAVLLGPHDAPFTSTIDQPDGLRLRLFGEFLEKGVIRRARPRVIIDRTGRQIDADLIDEAWNALAQSPLPLS
jgi:hypothetical protein